jgi:hypothetical protein
MDPEQWRAQRMAYWRRINWTLNLLMLAAILLLVWRYTRG